MYALIREGINSAPLILRGLTETLLASGDFSKDGDRDSTENGSSNGDFQPAPPGGNGVSAGPPPAQPPPALDASSMLAAREKTLISRAMDTVAKQVERMDSDATSAEQEDAEEEMFTVEGKLLKEALFKFTLTTPSPMPTHLNVHFICETASRLLFLSIHWVRSIPAFSQLR